MALKEIYQIKIGPLAPRWRHHDMPTITDKTIKVLNEPDFEDHLHKLKQKQLLMESTLVLINTIMHRFQDQLDVFQPHTQYGITNTVQLEKCTNHTVNTCTTKHSKKCNSENNVPNGYKQMSST